MTGACHAPVNGRQGKGLAGTDPTASPVPIEKSADLEMDGREDFQILSACGRQLWSNFGCGKADGHAVF